jgi:hypothetical protein
MARRVVTEYDPERAFNLPRNLEYQRGVTYGILALAACKLAGVNPWPIARYEAIPLLRSIGLAATRKNLGWALGKGYIPRGRKDRQGVVRYTEDQFIAVSDYFHQARLFMPLHPCIVHWLSPQEKAKHTAELMQRTCALETYREFDSLALLNAMVECGDRDLRELIAVVLRERAGTVNYFGTESVPAAQPQIAN